MENYNQFINTWSKIYPYYAQIAIVILLAVPLAYFLIILIQNFVSDEKLQKIVIEGSGINFVTKDSLPFMSAIIILFSLSLLLSIIPSYIRWLLQLSPVPTNYYILITFLILYIFYILYIIPELLKHQKSGLYISNDYILQKKVGNYILIPLKSIIAGSVDKEFKIIQLRYKRSINYLFRRKSKFTLYCQKENMFNEVVRILTENNISLNETRLRVRKRRTLLTSHNLDGIFNPEIFSSMPIKLVTVIENIYGSNNELNLPQNIIKKKTLFSSFILLFLFFFALIIWVPVLNPGDFLLQHFSAKDLSFILIFPPFLSNLSNNYFLIYQIKKELNQVFYTIATFIIAYILCIRVFKLKFTLNVKNKYQINKNNIYIFFLSLTIVIYSFFVIEYITNYLMYNNGLIFIYPYFGDIRSSLSYDSYQLLGLLIIAPIFEELIFRGLFLQYMKAKNYNILTIMVIEFLTFAFIHIPNYPDIPLPFLIENSIEKGIFAVIATFLVLKTENIIYSILYHASWNFFVTFYPYYITTGNIVTFKNLLVLLLVAISLIFLLWIIVKYKKFNKSKKEWGINKLSFWLSLQNILFIILLSQFFWVFSYYSSNFVVNTLFFTMKTFYALVILTIPFFVLYFCIKPHPNIYALDN